MMSHVRITPECQTLMEKVGLAPEAVIAALGVPRQANDYHRGSRRIVCHWQSDDRMILVDCDVTKTEHEPEDGEDQAEAILVHVALELRPQLPAGRIAPDMDAEQTLAIVAESFGIPLTCDPDEPISTLYSGPGTEDTVVVHSGCIPPVFWLVGSFDPVEADCDMVWAFRPDRFLVWFELIQRQ